MSISIENIINTKFWNKLYSSPMSGGKSTLNLSALVRTSFSTPFHFLLMDPTCRPLAVSTILKRMSLLEQHLQQRALQQLSDGGP